MSRDRKVPAGDVPVSDVAVAYTGDCTGLSQVLRALTDDARQAARISFSQRLTLFQQISTGLLRRDSGLTAVLSQPGAAFLAGFLSESNLRQIVARELPQPGALEQFTPIGERKSLRVMGRGLAAHWIAGNVPMLGLFSWAMSALVGNTNIVRLSGRQDDLLSPILRYAAELSPHGAQFAAETAVLKFDKELDEVHRQLSAVAAVRVIWGGQDSIETIRSLPCKWHCDDILLGPRFSMAVIDPAETDAGLMTRLVTDIVYFDQLACSSPQWLFVKGNREDPEFASFVKQLCCEFERQSAAIPRHTLDFSETYRIQYDRARILLTSGELHRDSQTQWSVAVVNQPDATVTCANRFLQVIPFEAANSVCQYIPENVQTVVTLVSPGEYAEFTETAASCGVCRFPRPGEGNHFEVPWDGVPLVSRLTRWIIRTDPRAVDRGLEEPAGCLDDEN